MAAVVAVDEMHASVQALNPLLQIVGAVASHRRAASGVCWQDAIEHRSAQFFCWAVVRLCRALPKTVWQRSTQAARMAAQSTAMAGVVASSIMEAVATRTMRVIAFTPAPLRSGLGPPYNKFCRVE
jgi:hypothetical protein